MFNSQAVAYGFPLYQSRKRVKAAKITAIYSPSCVHAEPGASFTFDPAGKPTPQVGWYIVCYEDGYVSFSPPETFEAGNLRISGEGLSFGAAIAALKADRRVARAGWNGKGMWLVLIPSHAWDVDDISEQRIKIGLSTMLPWIGMKTADDGFVPWLASQTDMLAEDWLLVES